VLTRRAALGGLAGVALAAAAPALPYAHPATGLRREDAALLIRAYRELHPGLRRYLTAATLAEAEAQLLREAESAETPAALWLAATRFTAAVRCGHSYVNPYNQGKAMTAAVVDRPDRLPFEFRWIAGQMVVTHVPAPLPVLQVGMLVAAIDGITTPEILKSLLPLARADGSNDAKRIADLGVRGGSRYPDFDLLRTVTATSPAASATLDLQRAHGDRWSSKYRVEVPFALTRSAATPSAGEARFTAAMHGTAMVLTMPTWAVYDSKWDWTTFIDATVDSAIAADARTLVVDLRGNEGGLDCGDVLLARLIERPLVPAPAARCVRFRTTPADLDPHLDTWDDSFRRLGVDAVDGGDGLLTLPPEAAATIQPKGKRFAGTLVVLVDAACSSATFHFAEQVRAARLGTIIGEPTGGNRRGINGGAFFFVRLPHSRLEIDLPLIGYFPATPQPDAGLIPDIIAAPTVASITAGTDPALTLAVAG